MQILVEVLYSAATKHRISGRGTRRETKMERSSTPAATLESLQDATSKTHEQGYHDAIKLTRHTIGCCHNLFKEQMMRTFWSDNRPIFTD